MAPQWFAFLWIVLAKEWLTDVTQNGKTCGIEIPVILPDALGTVDISSGSGTKIAFAGREVFKSRKIASGEFKKWNTVASYSANHQNVGEHPDMVIAVGIT